MIWRNFQHSVKRRVAVWEAAFLQRAGELMRVLRQPDFWFSLIWVVLATGMLLGLAWFAVSQYDTFLRLQPRLCTKSLNNTRLLVIVMVAPLSLVFTLVASSEFLALRKRRAERRRNPDRSLPKHLVKYRLFLAFYQLDAVVLGHPVLGNAMLNRVWFPIPV
jgi:hypothetical protein